ncbi:MAG: aldehyde dehydrogenase family protein [Nitrospira sp.]
MPQARRISSKWYGEAIDEIFDEVAPTGPGDLALVRRVPLGVVGAVVPWNFPLDMATWKSAAGLLPPANFVVLKPARQYRPCRRCARRNWLPRPACPMAC